MEEYSRPLHPSRQDPRGMKGHKSGMSDHQEREHKRGKAAPSKSQQMKHHHQNQGQRHQRNQQKIHQSDKDENHAVHSTTEDSVFSDHHHYHHHHPSHPHHQENNQAYRSHSHHHHRKQKHRPTSLSRTTSTGSSSSSSSSHSSSTSPSSSLSSSSSSSSFSSSSSSSSTSSMSSESTTDSSDRYAPVKHSQSCSDISKKYRYFEDGDDTAPLIDKKPDQNLRGGGKVKSSAASPAHDLKTAGKPQGGLGTSGSFRKAKSMEALSMPKESEWDGEVRESEKERSEARKNLMKEKMKFSAFLNEITRQVLSPMRLSTLGVTDAKRPSSPGHNSVRSVRVESSTERLRQHSRPTSAESSRSSKQTQTSKTPRPLQCCHHGHHQANESADHHERRPRHGNHGKQHHAVPNNYHHHHRDHNKSDHDHHGHHYSPVRHHSDHHYHHSDNQHEDHHDNHSYPSYYGQQHIQSHQHDDYNKKIHHHHEDHNSQTHRHGEHRSSGRHRHSNHQNPKHPSGPHRHGDHLHHHHHHHHHGDDNILDHKHHHSNHQNSDHQHHHGDSEHHHGHHPNLTHLHHHEDHQHHHHGNNGDQQSSGTHVHQHEDNNSQSHEHHHGNQQTLDRKHHHGDHQHHHHGNNEHQHGDHHHHHHGDHQQHHHGDNQQHHHGDQHHLHRDHQQHHHGNHQHHHHGEHHHHHHEDNQQHHHGDHQHHLHGDHPQHHHGDHQHHHHGDHQHHLHGDHHQHHHGDHHHHHGDHQQHHHGDHHQHHHHGDHQHHHHGDHQQHHHGDNQHHFHGDNQQHPHGDHHDHDHHQHPGKQHIPDHHHRDNELHHGEHQGSDHQHHQEDHNSQDQDHHPGDHQSDSVRSSSGLSSHEEEPMSFNSLHKEKDNELGRIMILQEQNEGLHQSLLKTAVRMECLGEEFISSQKLLEAELQRTRMEFNNLTERFKRLHDSCSSTQQSNSLLEQRLQLVAHSMEGERERLNRRISALTEKLADAKHANSVETFSGTLMLQRNEQDFLSGDTMTQVAVPLTPPPIEFMDNHSFGKIQAGSQELPLGSVPEEEESDWSELGEETPRFILTGSNRGPVWRHQDGDMDKDSESGGEDIFGRQSPRPLQIPHLQFTIHNENMSDGMAGEGTYRLATSPTLSSAILIRSASLEDIPHAHHEMQKELRGTEAMMDLHHHRDTGTDNQIIHHWRGSNDIAIARPIENMMSEAESSLVSLQSAEIMLNHFICEHQTSEGDGQGRDEVHGWTGGIPDQVWKGERTQL